MSVNFKNKIISLNFSKIKSQFNLFLISLNEKSRDTKGTYDRALREFLRWIEPKKVFKFNIIEVEKYKNYLQNKKKLSSASVSTYLTSLRQFFDFLIKQKIIKNNPADFVKGEYKKFVHTRDTLTFDEIKILLNSVNKIDETGFRDFAILKLMSTCGLTEIEIVRADIGDIKFKKNNEAILFIQGKGAKEKNKSIYISKDIINAIKNYLVFRFNVSNNDALFNSAGHRIRGKRMSTRGVRGRVTFHLRKSGLLKSERKITPFSLRHFAISNMIKNGKSIDEIKEIFRIGTNATAMIYFNKKENQIV